jgi:hypothetical protein
MKPGRMLLRFAGMMAEPGAMAPVERGIPFP